MDKNKKDKIKGAYYGWFFGPGASVRQGLNATYLTIKEHSEWSEFDSFEDLPSDYKMFDQLTQTKIVQTVLLRHGKITPELFKERLLELNERDDILNNDQYGPSTKKAVKKLVGGADPRETGKEGKTTGGAMRCLPIGIYFRDDKEKLIKNTYESCIISHNTDVAISAALAVNLMISALIKGKDKEEALNYILKEVRDSYGDYGEPTAFAHMDERIKYAVECIEGKNFEEATRAIARKVGFSWYAIEQIPAAFAVYFATEDAKQAEFMSFKLGYGDTGPQIACALHGAEKGSDIFPKNVIENIEKVNDIDIDKIVEEVVKK